MTIKIILNFFIYFAFFVIQKIQNIYFFLIVRLFHIRALRFSHALTIALIVRLFHIRALRFSHALTIALIGLAQSAHAATTCASIDDVVSAKQLNSYLVISKTHFFKNCENDKGLCETKQYVVAGDYLLAGFYDEALCAAYIPAKHKVPSAIGWIEDNGTIKPTKSVEYEQILGAWFANDRPIYKSMEISRSSDETIEIYGDLFSRTSNRMNFLEGRVFKINSDSYIVLNGDCKDIITTTNQGKLDYIANCEAEFSPFIFAGNYHKTPQHDDAQCRSLDDILWARDFTSYSIGKKTYFLARCEADKGETGEELCQTDQYVVAGDYLLAAPSAEKLCAAYIPQSYTMPYTVGWIKLDKDHQIVAPSDYEEIVGEWRFDDDEATKKIRIEAPDTASSETGAYLQGKISAHANEHNFFIEGYVYKTGKAHYVFANKGTCRLNINFNNGRLEVTDKTLPGCSDELTVSGNYHKKDL